MNFHHQVTLVVFILTYIGIAFGHVRGTGLGRTGIVLIASIILLSFNCVHLEEATDYVNVPSVLILFGLFLVSAQLRLAGLYGGIAQWIARFIATPARFLAILMASSAILSAFLNNDIVCAAFTPIIAQALLRARANPIPYLIALALSSNIGCALTLIGNAQNVLVGQLAHLNFGGYMWFAAAPVVLSLLAAYALLLPACRKSASSWLPSAQTPVDAPALNPEQIFKGLLVISVVVGLYFTHLPRSTVTLAGAAVLLFSRRVTSKRMLSLVDWEVILLFIGLFVVVGAFEKTGMPDRAVAWIIAHGWDLNNPFKLAFTTAVLSNLINNSAAVMLLAHVVDLQAPLNGYILALANTFGGNLLLIGSVASLIVAKSAADQGLDLSFRGFARHGVPVALVSFVILLVWIGLAGKWVGT